MVVDGVVVEVVVVTGEAGGSDVGVDVVVEIAMCAVERVTLRLVPLAVDPLHPAMAPVSTNAPQREAVVPSRTPRG